MQQPAEALAVRAPAQVGHRIDRAFGCLAEDKRTAECEEVAADAAQGDLVCWHLAVPIVDTGVWIAEDCVADLREAGPHVRPVSVDNCFNAELAGSHGVLLTVRWSMGSRAVSGGGTAR